ncbi:MAG: hypothetical protein DMF24_01820 [Verrucomicrobia bacterium]|nr:MAG: hypothetical protein DMF24_01820 [Verrucomicrobiota bacterium]
MSTMGNPAETTTADSIFQRRSRQKANSAQRVASRRVIGFVVIGERSPRELSSSETQLTKKALVLQCRIPSLQCGS